MVLSGDFTGDLDYKLTSPTALLSLIVNRGNGSRQIGEVTLTTLGSSDTCYERAALECPGFRGIDDCRPDSVDDFCDGLERTRGKDGAFRIQCSAHPKVHEVTERDWSEVFVVDICIYPTMALAVLSCGDIERPRTLGLGPATSGHVDLTRWDEVVDVQSKPIAARTSCAWSRRSGKSPRRGRSMTRARDAEG